MLFLIYPPSRTVVALTPYRLRAGLYRLSRTEAKPAHRLAIQCATGRTVSLDTGVVHG